MKIAERMTYKEHTGTIEWSEPDHCYFGQLLKVKGLVSYEGENLKDLEKDFHVAVDDYISFSKKYHN